MGYTNSLLVSYTKLSPNHSGQRTHSIDRITPHCVVGQCSVETLGEIFAPSSRQASSNYGIGVDGRVAMYVEEKNRSWCSSSNANDQRAVTIECASDTTEPYAMNGKVYATLLTLCIDICSRNGKKKLLWFADKDKSLNYEPAADEMVLTVHRWFANKSCPGNWLYERLGELAKQVTFQLCGATPDTEPVKQEPAKAESNVLYRVQVGAFSKKENAEDMMKKLKADGYDAIIVESKKETPAPAPVEQTAAADATIWNFLIGKGLNAYAVAGIMGNLYAESALHSNNLQGSYEKSLGMTDAQYTAAVDDGFYTNFVNDSAGYGLAQWTHESRKEALLNFAKAAKKSIGDFGMQLDFLWTELQSYKAVMNVLRNATSVRAVSDVILTQFEKPADQSEDAKKRRAGYSQDFYDKFVGKQEQATDFPYLVVVTTDVLNVRQSPNTSAAIVTEVKRNEVYTIVDECDGWGKLKSGAGWICLDYAAKL